MTDEIKGECARCGALLATGDVAVDVALSRKRLTDAYNPRVLGSVSLMLCVPCSGVLDEEVKLPSAATLTARDAKAQEEGDSDETPGAD
jgi:hypothetical protein